MKFSLPGFLRRKEDTTLSLVEHTLGVLDGAYVSVEVHDARVNDLLMANNLEMERRRKAERRAATAELNLLREVRKGRSTEVFTRAIDYAARYYGGECIQIIDQFYVGFSGGKPPEPAVEGSHDYLTPAFAAGALLKTKEIALGSATKSVVAFLRPTT